MSLFARGRGDLPRISALPKRRTRVISVLDVGSEKVTCLIARLRPRLPSEMLPGRTHAIEVVGVGHQRSHGIKSGVVVDLDAAEQAIRHCVEAAERMAGLTIESLTAGRLKSLRGHAEIDTDGEITRLDIAKVLGQAARVPLDDNRVALHSIGCDYAIDGEGGVDLPIQGLE